MSHAHAAPPGAPTSMNPRRWVALVLLCLAQFMLIVDITVVQVALPSIGADLSLSREPLTWVIAGYTVAFGGLMVLGGRLADAFGARRTLTAGLAVFTLASLVCGLASNGPVLLAGRALQGIGAALLSPAALATITTTFHGAERHRALGVWAGIGGSGAAVGVLLSGLLTAGPGWEWIFFVNVPVGGAVLIALPMVVHQERGSRGRQRVDLPGALLVTLPTGLLVYGLVNAGDAGWGAAGTLLPLGGSVLGYVVFLVVESRTRVPLMRPAILLRRPVLSGTFLMLVATALLLGLFFLTSLYFQYVLGFSALRTGLLFLPVAVAITLGAHLAGRLVNRVGGRPIAVTGLLLTAAGAAVLTGVSPGDGIYTTVLPGFVIAAFGIGPVFVTATTTTLANIPPADAGVASGVLNTFHELGGSIGVAVVSTVAAASLTASGVAAAPLHLDGFTGAYLLCALTAGLASLIAAVVVPAGRPTGVVGHGHAH